MFDPTSNLSVNKIYDDDDYPLLMPRWGYVAAAMTLFVIGFFGFFLNLLVIVLMFKDRQLWTPLNIILFNLVCSDFSVSVLGNPFTLVSALYHRWVFGETMCVIYGFFMSLLGITSITTLTVLSFERYLLVSKPTNPRHLTSSGAGLMIVFIWCYSLALTTPPLFGWGNYVNEAADISCSVNWEDKTQNTLTYILFLFAFGQIVPVIIIAFSYVNIIRTMKKNAVRMGQVNKAEAKVTMMVFLMILAFMFAWTPYSILALMEQFAPYGIVSPGVGVIPALIAKSSICYNPLIYVGMNSQYRASIQKLLSIDKVAEENTAISQTRDATILNESKIKANFNVTLLPKVTIKGTETSPRNAKKTTDFEEMKSDEANQKTEQRVVLKSDKDETANELSKNITLTVHTLDDNDCVKNITKTEIINEESAITKPQRKKVNLIKTVIRTKGDNNASSPCFDSPNNNLSEEIVGEEIV